MENENLAEVGGDERVELVGEGEDLRGRRVGGLEGGLDLGQDGVAALDLVLGEAA